MVMVMVMVVTVTVASGGGYLSVPIGHAPPIAFLAVGTVHFVSGLTSGTETLKCDRKELMFLWKNEKHY